MKKGYTLAFILGLMTICLFGYTRDWTESTPTDATIANQIDDYNRYLRVDMSDRLKNMIYGFTAGETTEGFKYLQIYEQASVSQPSASYGRLYGLAVSTKCELHWQDEDGDEIQLTSGGKWNGAVLLAASIPSGSYAADSIDSADYAAASIDAEHLAADIIDETKIADDGIDSEHYNDGSIDAAHLAAGSSWRHDGTQVYNANAPTSFTNLDLSSYVGANRALVYLKIAAPSATTQYYFRAADESLAVGRDAEGYDGGCSSVDIGSGNIGYVIVETHAGGVVGWKGSAASDTDVWLMGYVK